MKRFEKISVLIAGPIVGSGAAFYVWSASYAAASYFILKSSNMWKNFAGGDVLMPAEQAWVYLGNPLVRKLISTATISTLALSGIAAVAITLAIKRPWQVQPPPDGSRFATLRDLQTAGLVGGLPGKSVLLGTFGKGREAVDVRYSGDSHFFVNGPSRSGKGRSFVMPNLLEYEGSVIVLDVKLENHTLTGPARLAMGQQCFVFAPGSARSHRWNPLDFVRSWPERSTDLINLAASLLPIGEKEDAYWKQTARGLLAGALGYVLEAAAMEGRRNLRSVLQLFSTGRPFSAVLQEIVDNEPKLDQFILGSFRQHLARDEEQRPSFESHVTTALSAFNNLLIAETCSGSDFDIRDLRRKAFSLFIAAPVSDFGTAEPIIRLLIQQIHDVMLRSLPAPDEPHKVLMMLDEFYQFERLPEIVKRAPLVAGYGLTIALVAQNIPQIDERYGQQTRNALLGNMDVKLSIAIGDDATAKIVSDNLGRKYVEREGWGRQTGILFGKQASSGRFELVPLIDPGSVQRLDDGNTILQIRSGYGAILNKLNFYSDARFLARRREVEGWKKELVIPDVKLQSEWPLFTRRPPELASGSQVVGLPVVEGEPRQSETTDYEIIVLAHARTTFVEPARLMHLYRSAVSAAEDQPTADLLFRLRTAPETIGDLNRGKSRFSLRGRRLSEQSTGAVWLLRNAISEGRWAVIGARLSRSADQYELYFTPDFNPTLPSVGSLDAEEGASEKLDLGFSSVQQTVDEVSTIAENAIGNGHVNDPKALTAALSNFKTALRHSTAEVAEENTLLISI